MTEDKKYPLTPDQQIAVAVLQARGRRTSEDAKQPGSTSDQDTVKTQGPHTAKLKAEDDAGKGPKR